MPRRFWENSIADAGGRSLGTDPWPAELLTKARASASWPGRRWDSTTSTSRGNGEGESSSPIRRAPHRHGGRSGARPHAGARRGGSAKWTWVRAGSGRPGEAPLGWDDPPRRPGDPRAGASDASPTGARAFHMPVLYHDAVRARGAGAGAWLRFVELTRSSGRPTSSASTPPLPPKPRYRRRALLATMKPTAYLINTSRAPGGRDGADRGSCRRSGGRGGAGRVRAGADHPGEPAPDRWRTLCCSPTIGAPRRRRARRCGSGGPDNVWRFSRGSRRLTPVNPEVLSRVKR